MTTVAAGRHGLLTCILHVALFVAPHALYYGKFTWAFLAAWVGLGGLRAYWGEKEVWTDVRGFGVLQVWLLRKELWNSVWIMWTNSGMITRYSEAHIVAYALVVLLAVVAVCLHIRYSSSNPRPSSDGIDTSAPPARLQPLIFSCRTTHARMFPKRHAFNYSYLLYGIPITPRGGGSGTVRAQGRWWMQVRAEDHLFRGQGHLGFYRKLKAYLEDQGVQDTAWSYAYLITAPRFLGYSFNPVSFWYIYDELHQLKRMILEVNNTFGERRMYLLDGSSPTTSSNPEDPQADTEPHKRQFTDVWLKDFHVSPFNSRKGAYTLKALNPFPYPDTSVPYIDNTITLKSSKDHAKIVARVFSKGPPIIPSQLGTWGTLRFIASWWWVGLVTFPRIVREAGKLFFNHDLHVWFRPEVLVSSIGRVPTETEIAVQGVFERYLEHIVDSSSTNVWNIVYHTAIPDRPRRTIATSYASGHTNTSKCVDIRVLTPAFYTRLVHYRHISEAFDREGLFTEEKNRTIWISNPELLPQLLPKPGVQSKECKVLPRRRGAWTELQWILMKNLRCEPPPPTYPTSPKLPCDSETDDIRALPYSDMDVYVRGLRDESMAARYRRITTKLFLSRFTLRIVEIVTALDWLLRLFAAYLGSAMLLDWGGEAAKYGIGTYLEGPEPGSCVAHLRGAHTEWYMLLGYAFWTCACHFYGMLKGFS